MDHGTRATLLEGDLESPRGIAVHPGVGRMFWTDWDRLGPKIESANMDGTDRMVSSIRLYFLNLYFNIVF